MIAIRTRLLFSEETNFAENPWNIKIIKRKILDK